MLSSSRCVACCCGFWMHLSLRLPEGGTKCVPPVQERKCSPHSSLWCLLRLGCDVKFVLRLNLCPSHRVFAFEILLLAHQDPTGECSVKHRACWSREREADPIVCGCSWWWRIRCWRASTASTVGTSRTRQSSVELSRWIECDANVRAICSSGICHTPRSRESASIFRRAFYIVVCA